MNKHLQQISNIIHQDESLSPEKKNAILKSLKDADKELEIATFKLDRTEKVKRTTAILLEETIAELEQKRKAVEAQNRDLEIEAAVERVRADAMAMHSTNDFHTVCQQLLEQIKSLNLEGFTGSSICLIDENQIMRWWDFASPGNIGDPKSQTYKYDAKKYKILGKDTLEQWHKGEPYMVFEFNMEKLLEATKEWEDIDVNVANTFRKVIAEGKLTHQWNPAGRLSNGFLTFDMLKPPDDDVRKITIKMAHAFEQTYTRFLDLQKAEAQARESQIQLALERVRARTMSMHHSSELADTATILFQQIKELGFEIWSCGFGIWRPEVDLEEAWMSTGDLFPIITVPFREDLTHLSIYEASQRGESVFEVEVKGEVLTRHYDWLMSQPSFKKVFNQIDNSGITLPTVQWKYAAFFKQGYLHLITTKPQPDIHNINQRFAKVFEQTYTRFLDLQKVETQAREAQIENALEKVRSRSLAMHKSDELWEVVTVVFEKFQELNFSIDGAAFIGTFIEGSGFFNCWLAGNEGQPYPTILKVPYYDAPSINDIWKAKESGVDFFSKTYSFEEKNLWLSYAFEYTDLKIIADEFKNWILEQPCLTQPLAFGKNSFIGIHFHHEKTLSEAEVNTLKRFSKVFDQAYIRFLDLQKAEVQAREAQIEVAVERVRAKALAMHKSAEIMGVAVTMRIELETLNMPGFDAATISLIQDDGSIRLWDNTSAKQHEDGTWENTEFIFRLEDNHPDFYLNKIWSSKDRYIVVEQNEHDLKITTDWVRRHDKNLAEVVVHYYKENGIKQAWHPAVALTYGRLNLDFYVHAPEPEVENILIKMAAAFDLAYKRFLDLQNAEAQARESQIQLALERVRSRSMAMHHSHELTDIVILLNQEFDKLKINNESTDIEIGLIDEETGIAKVWAHLYLSDGTISTFSFPFGHFDQINHEFEKWKSTPREKRNELFITTEFSHELWEKFKELAKEIPELAEMFESLIKANIQKWVTHNAYFSYGLLTLQGTNHYSEETQDILKRFAKVFEQTYTRFLDLQKAEAQAREAQIEAALERVRSHSMGMQKSDELRNVVQVIYEQFMHLGIDVFGAGFIMDYREKDDWYQWAADFTNSFPHLLHIPYFDHPYWNAWNDAKRKGLEALTYTMALEEKNSYVLGLATQIPDLPTEATELVLSTPGYTVSNVFLNNVALYIDRFNMVSFSNEDNAILLRFGKVFEQTYTRFKDLEKAETQAREAQIEAALERVRARTMAMQRSEELPEVAGLLFQQVKTLGVPQFHCGFNIFEIDDKECTWYPGSADGDILPPCKIPLTEHPVFMNFIESRKRGDELCVYEKEGEYQAGHYRYMLSLPVLGEILQNMLDAGIPFPTFQIDHLANFSHGNLLFITSEHFPEMHDTFKRFAKVFEQTYTRFLDLQKAEAQAQEAIKRASVDRVRAEIASMRTLQDLDRITPLIWKELTTLSIPFVRCGVFIMNDEQQAIHTYLSTPDGRAIAAFELTYNAAGNLANAITNWREHKQYVTHWLEKDFSEQADTLIKQGALSSREQYLATIPKEGIYLHFLPFLQGMLYVGNTTALNVEQMDLIQSVADAFSTAYARYEDFNKLEVAKKQVDKTLVDLKQAQQQLVQSEKMASLGELTAGIAHEIQNPLNFVNNFSEVSTELVREMVDIVEKGNSEEVKAIAFDVAQNLEKINHHGKRAADIVKGMLQHSRTSTGQKELTDINALADEYLRLAYHGLRAKDKSFNAKLETNLDSALPKLNVIPQDIGRVLLNLINNASYAVSEKSKLESQKSGSGYEPTVIVTTKKLIDKIEIRVKDNGNGIPDSIKEKIFQPFFTTKPTGQGTGLGLSLAYDIVKAHGGELKVETKEGEGSAFTINLPIT